MRKKLIIYILLFGAIHFAFSILSIAKGFFIFSGPSTPSGIFWQRTMNVLLFPANVLWRSEGNQWEQTLAIVLNSLLWGTVFAFLYYGWRILRKKA
jgi:hypothetical protein